MPKRGLDVMACEVMRGVRVTAKTVEYVSFKVPRKAGTFQADLYPPARTGEPAMKFDEYWSGVDKDPIRVEVKPEVKVHDHAHAQRKTTFLARLGAKDTSAQEEKKEANFGSGNEKALQEEI